jgi:hypothetical protein
MKRTIALFFLLTVVFFACKTRSSSDYKQKILGTWHAVRMENADMDSFFLNSQHYIDTVGKNNDDATNIRLYGVANMDSMRKILQLQYDSAKNMQNDAVVHTIFTFRPDNVAVLTFSGAVDSSKWGIDTSGKLVLSEMNPNGPVETMSMDILMLNDTVMRLKMMENNTFSTVTFYPDKK